MRKKRHKLQFRKSSSKFPIIIFIISLLIGSFFGFRIISTLIRERETIAEPFPVERQTTKTPQVEITRKPESQEKVKAKTQETREKRPEVAKEKVEQKREIKVKEFYTIQVATFKDRKRAEVLGKQLKEKDLSPIYIRRRGEWFEVWVGKFTSRKESGKFLPRLQEDFHDAFIRKLTPPFKEVF